MSLQLTTLALAREKSGGMASAGAAGYCRLFFNINTALPETNKQVLFQNLPAYF
jgi:hypothetical protein